MIQLSDYVIDFLVKKGIKDIFLVSGGGIMYLLDSVGRNKKIRYIANYHEQASATAAESYARFTNKTSVCLVTTGPGSTNAITGVAAAWVDSIPMIVISGQVKREIIADYKKMRQFGPQEINTYDLVRPITKYAKTITDPMSIKFELEKAFYESFNARPGPVWLNIPLDVQGLTIDERKLKGFVKPTINKKLNVKILSKIDILIDLLKESKRPIIIAGNGVRLAGAIKNLNYLINKYKIPVVTDENGLDLFTESDEYYMGRYGPKGQRRANFALQNSDLVLSIGASLNIASTGFDYKKFAPHAKKIMINIDPSEMSKYSLKIDLPINIDANIFLEILLYKLQNIQIDSSFAWYKALKMWKLKYKTIIPEYFKDKEFVNSYLFVDILSDLLKSSDTVVTGMGLDVISILQSFKVKKNQRVYVNKNFGQMGWCLPAAIGACVANEMKRTILVTGDGSIQFNIHELGTIGYYNLPVKIFIFNNNGYKSIRDTQKNLFQGRLVGADNKSGVSNPDFKILAKAYNIKYLHIMNNNEIKAKITKSLKIQGPTIIEVNIFPDQERLPRTATFRRTDGTLESRPLEDMFPFLPKEEVYENMHMFDK